MLASSMLLDFGCLITTLLVVFADNVIAICGYILCGQLVVVLYTWDRRMASQDILCNDSV